MSGALPILLIALRLAIAGVARAEDWSAWQRAYDPATGTRFIPVELWTGAAWNGAQCELRPNDAFLSDGTSLPLSAQHGSATRERQAHETSGQTLSRG